MGDISESFSMEDMKRLANSKAGKQLFDLLQKADPAVISKAMQQASTGNYAQAKQALEPLLKSQDMQAILQQMEGNSHG